MPEGEVKLPKEFKSQYGEWYADFQSRLDDFVNYIREEFKLGFPDCVDEILEISFRVKSPESCYVKLCTGKYSKFNDMDDLLGVKIVVLHALALQRVKSALSSGKIEGVEVGEWNRRKVEPSDFSFHEPKSVLRDSRRSVSEDRAVRDNDGTPIGIELQITTAIQHALDMATHDFDYKGSTYRWSNFRQVSRLRAIAETLDSDILSVVEVGNINSGLDAGDIPDVYAQHEALLCSLRDGIVAVNHRLGGDLKLPSDVVRTTRIVAKWMESLDVPLVQVSVLFENVLDGVWKKRTLTVMEKLLAAVWIVSDTPHEIYCESAGDLPRLPISESMMDALEECGFDRIPVRYIASV